MEPLLNCHRLICAVTVLTPSPRVKTNTCTEKTKPRESIVPVSNQVRDQPPNPPHALPFEPFRRSSTLASMDAARRLCGSDGSYAVWYSIKLCHQSGPQVHVLFAESVAHFLLLDGVRTERLAHTAPAACSKMPKHSVG